MATVKPRVVVVGAGAFGGWTALELKRRGADVTVIDAWGPGNVRASSGGETRVMRSTYGTRGHYTALATRALARWREFETLIQRRIFYATGVLWMIAPSAEALTFAQASADALEAHGSALQQLSASEAARRYPQIDFTGVGTVLFEADAGYLMARQSCDYVIERLIAEGGIYRLRAASFPVRVDDLHARRLPLTDGTVLDADCFIFAAGPWLASLFPDVVGRRIISTRQEVYYFGPPAGDPRFTEQELPVWIDVAGSSEVSVFYGIPGNAHRGFKVADDRAGPEMDPTAAARDASTPGVAAARAFLGRRFPDLAAAPLVGSEVCQYEATPDSELIVDRHPDAPHVWLAGGGSGHGFKMGPALGELVASLVLADLPVEPRFALARLGGTPQQAWQRKWT